jgi:hypothetical protein
MWVGRPTYLAVSRFIAGFGVGRGDGVIAAFQDWLVAQSQNRTYRNFAWWSLILLEAFPDRRGPTMTRTAEAEPKPSNWPVPADPPIGEGELAYPEDDQVAIAHLCARLKQFLDQDAAVVEHPGD